VYAPGRMWQLENRTPYAAERNWVRDKQGAHQWIVAVKATFDVPQRGDLELADEQRPVLYAPEFNGEDGASSVRYEMDLGPLKPATDVWVNGHAVAPKERPVSELPISLRFGTINKTLLVRGDNVFHEGVGGLTTTAPRPFVRIPVTYERAYGGFDTTHPDATKHRMFEPNPVGVGYATRSAHLEHKPGPNIVFPGRSYASSTPAGFGAIAAYWAPRLALAGTYDGAWVENRKPLLPTDYDPKFTLCSPADQRTKEGYVLAGTRFELVHMTPSGVMAFTIPAVRLRFVTRFGTRREEHPGFLTSVVLDAEHEQVQFVWQSSLSVRPTQIDTLDQTSIEEVSA